MLSEPSLTLLAIAILLVFLVRSKMRSDKLRQLTQLDSTDSQIEANTTESGHSYTYYVTKDPQKYAEIFIPNGAKK